MIDRPDVRYAHNGDVAIAYQVFGQGHMNLVCVPGFISNLHWNWELPELGGYSPSWTPSPGLPSWTGAVSDRLSPRTSRPWRW